MKKFLIIFFILSINFDLLANEKHDLKNTSSIFNHVDFKYLNGFNKNPYAGGIIMGAINFNNTQLTLKNIFLLVQVCYLYTYLSLN